MMQYKDMSKEMPDCDDCKYRDVNFNDMPCRKCRFTHCAWEPRNESGDDNE